jgi:maleate isomerase
LPVLPIIDELEKKLNTTVLSSNQALIWDTLEKINKNNSVEGFGKLFQSN